MSAPEPVQKTLNWSPNIDIVLPSPDQEKRMSIRVSDWNRLKGNVARCSEPFRWLQAVYAVMFGFAVSELEIFLETLNQANSALWALYLHGLLSLFTGIVAVVFLVLEREMHSKRASDIQLISGDMGEIESGFNVESTTPSAQQSS